MNFCPPAADSIANCINLGLMIGELVTGCGFSWWMRAFRGKPYPASPHCAMAGKYRVIWSRMDLNGARCSHFKCPLVFTCTPTLTCALSNSEISILPICLSCSFLLHYSTLFCFAEFQRDLKQSQLFC